MVATWHEQFNPRQFLSRVDIERFIEKNEAYNENKVEHLENPCIFCNGIHGPGLLLNDKSYLCKSCFADISKVRYPEKYENLYRQFLIDREARKEARAAFLEKWQIDREKIKQARQNLIENCRYRRIANWARIATWLSLLFLYFYFGFLLVTIVFFLIDRIFHSKHEGLLSKWDAENPPPPESLLDKWDALYPPPIEPDLKHFHDPTAELTNRDKLILKVFNNWPGYPPFWRYLREVVLRRDNNRCQVSGCPSRVALHIHHKTPVSQGGEHIPTNLISLCSFHHALEPEEGHERIWGEIKTKYFTMVRAHKRRHSSLLGYQFVRAHIRRLELTEQSELISIKDYYGLSCPSCGNDILNINVEKRKQQVTVQCLKCGENWLGIRQLCEETGPRLAEILNVTKNKGCWAPLWDMLETRADAAFRMLKRASLKAKADHKTIKTVVDTIPKCPKCGSPMRFIKPKQGAQWDAFWGCSKYKTTGCNGAQKA